MSREVIEQIVSRAIGDAAFRRQLQSNPGAALRGFKLTADERSALTSRDPKQLSALGIDQRMSRVFVIGDAGGASAVAGTDVGGGSGYTVQGDDLVPDAHVITGGAGASTPSVSSDNPLTDAIHQVRAADTGGTSESMRDIETGMGEGNRLIQGDDLQVDTDVKVDSPGSSDVSSDVDPNLPTPE